MADHYKGLTDAWGRPIEKKLLTQEIAAPTVTGVRSPLTGYPGDGLNPGRLAAILKEADAGDPLRYLELAETVEERDPHYAGVLGTRKRAVAQLDITVEAASDDAGDVERADMVRDWLGRDELADELFDILDAAGKGYSFTEIVWDFSERQYRPQRLEWRDPRWFRFSRTDGATPLLIGEHGEEGELPPFKFIRAVMRAKSGIPARSGLARIVAWPWMFKMFTQRDWAIFTQTYGQPIRLGKYAPSATKDDRDTLFRAIANIAGDCAAIIPESMAIEFVEAKTTPASLSLYKDRCDWLDQQVSKAVLGQTATTDAIAGGHAVGREHRLVQEDIERADARQLSAILNRDLIRPWMALEYGPAVQAPRLKIGRAEEADVQLAVDAVAKLAPLGLKVGQNQMRDLVGLGAPAEDDELLAPPATPSSGPADHLLPGGEKETAGATKLRTLALAAMAEATPANVGDALTQAASEQAPTAQLLDAIRVLVDKAQSLDELRAMLEELSPGSELADLEALMRQAMLVAELTGRAELLPSTGSG